MKNSKHLLSVSEMYHSSLYYNIYCSVYVDGAFWKVFPQWFVGRFDIKGTEWNETTSTSSICS